MNERKNQKKIEIKAPFINVPKWKVKLFIKALATGLSNIAFVFAKYQT